MTSGYKNHLGLGQQKELWDSWETPFKGSAMDLGLKQTHSLWAAALGQQLEGHQWHVGRN